MKIQVRVLSIIAGLVSVANLFSIAQAQTPAHYFRVWEGFRRPDVSEQAFLGELPSFMEETVDLYGGRGLSNYIVVVPPASKPAFIPDELALVALSDEASYRQIRQTPEGKRYGDRHWDIFDKSVSKSAQTFVDYQSQRPLALQDGVAYDVIGRPIDWATGYTLVFIGVKKSGLTPQGFLTQLQSHLDLAHRNMVPQGLRGYIVTAHNDYEVAYLNWPSKTVHDRAMQTVQSAAVFSDANRIMDGLMYQGAEAFDPLVQVRDGRVYTTVQPSRFFR